MKHYYSVNYTFYDKHPELNHYFIIELNEKEEETSYCIESHNAAMRYLRMVEKKLNRSAEISINPYEKSICRKEIRGWVEE